MLVESDSEAGQLVAGLGDFNIKRALPKNPQEGDNLQDEEHLLPVLSSPQHLLLLQGLLEQAQLHPGGQVARRQGGQVVRWSKDE